MATSLLERADFDMTPLSLVVGACVLPVLAFRVGCEAATVSAHDEEVEAWSATSTFLLVLR
jgi:hypothetical protein